MADLNYHEALRLGQKEYRARVAKGESPFLPVLEDVVPAEKLGSGVELGVVQVPSELIVGTKSRSRVNAFAANFMPILEENSEFADKWCRLCDAHLEEGIREPIKAYEYMNRFYVEEGNKRVSVLKYFGAVSIAAQVIRILPERNGEQETELYYEFVQFYKYSRINEVEFTRRGSYAALQREVGKEPDEPWSEEDRRHFATVCFYFKKAYAACGGGKLQSTFGDALLSYLQVYGYPALGSAGAEEIKRNLKRIWEEIALHQEAEPIELKLKPAEEKKPGLLQKVLPTAAPVLHAAFLYDGSPEQSGWVFGHESGRRHVQRVFEDRILTTPYFDVMDGDPREAIERAIADGNRLIFTTTPRLMADSLRAAVEHPDTVIMNCSLNNSHRYIRAYYARMYEAKFIIGALAGSLSESGQLGYICDYPIFGQIAGINAFALGAQMTSPRARVFLEWSSVKGAEEAIAALTERGIQLISSQDTASLRRGSRSSFGLFRLQDGQRELLARPVWNWGAYYEQILRRMLDKTVQSEYESSSKALNYYWGMSAGVADIVYSARLTDGSRRLADFLRESVCRELCNPFLTPLRTQDGGLVGEGQRTLSQEQIIGMDYLVENVIGSIPAYEELSPKGKAIADIVGVWRATREAAGAEQEIQR